MTNTYGINGDTSIETKEGTFLKHYDTDDCFLLTSEEPGRKIARDFRLSDEQFPPEGDGSATP